MNYNKAIIVGRATIDPVRKSLPSGIAVVNFSVATNRVYYDQAKQKQQEVEFHNVVAFGKLAEIIAQYLKKGSMVLIEGRLRTRNWQDQAGVKHYRTEIVTENMQLGPRAANAPQDGQNSPWQAPNSNSQPTTMASRQAKSTISPADIPIIQEEEPVNDTADNEEPLPSQDDGQDPFEKANDEIDVKNIPF